jgi:SPP1 gp7 family putative phage head morphogenesis protein
MPTREFSRDFKKDPTRSLPRINRMEQKVRIIMEAYQVEILRLVQGSLFTHEANNPPANIDPKALSPRVDEATDTSLKKPLTEVVEEEIPEAYESGIDFADVALGGDLATRQAHWEIVSALIERSDSYFKGLSEDIAKQIKATLADRVRQEQTLQEMIEAINALFDPEDVNQSRSLTIVRTEIMVAVNQGIKDRYKERGVKKLEWLTVMDFKDAMNPCEACEELDGKIFALDEVPPCPLHPRCRCTLLPVVELPPGEWYEEGEEPVKEKIKVRGA